MSKTMTNCQLRVLREALEAIEDYYLIDGTYDEAVDYGDCLPHTTKDCIKVIIDYETMKRDEAQEHCRDESTATDEYFDGYESE